MAPMNDQQTNILSGFVREVDFARQHDVSPKTVWRYRGQGLPFVIFAGTVWINTSEARAWLASRIRRRNQPIPSQQKRRAG
jgi:hypothetical protein